MSIRTFVILPLLAATLVSSCAEPSAPAELPPPEVHRRSSLRPNEAKRNQHTVRNKRLSRLPYCEASAAVTATATIGPSGGLMSIGAHTLYVPKGALPQPVTITAVVPPDTLALVQFQPDGLVFEQAALFTMSYAHCDVQRRVDLRIAQVNDDLLILEYLPSFDVDQQKKVTGLLSHFSNYAVAW